MRLLAVAALLLLFAIPLDAQKRKGRCSGDPPDSTALDRGPVYRDCEVERKAKLLEESQLRFNWTPPTPTGLGERCYKVELQFVVDESGRVEFGTVRTVRSNEPGLESAVRGLLSNLRYEPAQLEGRAVRQIAVYARAVYTVSRVIGPNALPGPPPNPAQIRARC